MILFPMTQEQKSKVGTPIIPRSKVDPTQSARQSVGCFRISKAGIWISSAG
jgi:hypothetical protein